MSENFVTRGEALAEVTRGGVVESFHSGHLILLDGKGDELFILGNPQALVFPRSAIKSIQASAMVRAGLKLPSRLLALVSASHSGSKEQQEAVLEILTLANLDESYLRNSLDRPLGTEENREWGVKAPSSLAQNCSGKHAGMLNTCVVNGWPLDTYLDPEHPLQIACRQELENLSAEKVSLITVDGCGAPLYQLSLSGLAKAIHNLTISDDPIHQDVVSACMSYPEMVAGEGRLTTTLMRQYPTLFLKEGAEGVEIGSLSDGRTFVFKVNDGAARAHSAIVIACLHKLGMETMADASPIYGGGRIVGSIKATF